MREDKKKLTVGIIGSEGNMGKWFCRFFSELNEKNGKYYYKILKSDIKSPRSMKNEELISESDVVIFSLPIREIPKVMEECLPYSRKEQLWIEIASVKKYVWEAINKIDVNIIGLHPLFNQTISRMKNQTVLWLDGKKANDWEEWKEWLWGLLEENQAKIKRLNTPEEHDRLMAYIQVLVHFILICFGRTLHMGKGHFKEVELQEVQGNNFRLFLDLYSRIIQQPNKEELYPDIHFHNEYSLEIIDNFLQTANTLRDHLAKGNKEDYISLLNEPVDHFDRDLIKGAYEESKILFRLLADLDEETSCKVRIKESRPGALYEILSLFSEMGVNLTSIHGYEEHKGSKKSAEFLIGYENVPDETVASFCKRLKEFVNVEDVETRLRKSRISEVTTKESL